MNIMQTYWEGVRYSGTASRHAPALPQATVAQALPVARLIAQHTCAALGWRGPAPSRPPTPHEVPAASSGSSCSVQNSALSSLQIARFCAAVILATERRPGVAAFFAAGFGFGAVFADAGDLPAGDLPAARAEGVRPAAAGGGLSGVGPRTTSAVACWGTLGAG